MNTGRIKIIVVIAIWLATLTACLAWFLSARVQHITIAGGQRGSESYALAHAIARVFNESEANTTAEVFETGGSTENVALLEEGKVDVATMQANTQVYGGVQALASLYHDAYQLIVHRDSGIHDFHELAGHRVAIPPRSSAQYATFWAVANYYGLGEGDIIALPMAEDASNFAMIMQQVDAVFRVRAPGNQAIRELVQDYPMQLVPIPHAEALALADPAISAGSVAEGAYRGHPPLPKSATPTPIVKRLLVGRTDLDEDIAYKLTRTLFEHRSGLVAETSLAGFISPVAEDGSLSLPVHAGALRYYDREKPTFVQQNARVLSALLYAAAIACSAGIALRATWIRRRRVRMGDYNRELMKLADQAQVSTNRGALLAMKEHLVDMLRQVIEDLDAERVTQDEFEHFSFTWQAVDTLVRDRLTINVSDLGKGDEHD